MADRRCPACGTDALEVAHLKEALATRDVIGQAKGLLMATLNCGPDEAFLVLVEQSQRMNHKLRDVASDLVDRQRRATSV